ncbi:MAG: selenide, water dikinase SelD [bacterium]
MRFPEKRRLIMGRSMALGHCVCNPKQPCPCDILKKQNLCPCAGERPDPPKEAIRLTAHVRKAGCASKISHADLKRVLSTLPSYDDPNVLVGVAAGDDAGVYQIDGEYNLVQTVDVFSPVVDDPHTFGRICAANSVSDIYAMGGRPICALSVIGFPIEELPHEVMAEILRGGVETMREAGVSVIGGHSINDEEIKCGFAVSGLVKGKGSVTNSAAQPGDCLVLTKPIGTGLISFAAQIDRASDEAIKLIGQSMASLNKDAAELMLEFGAHACTDVTGFGLLGHLSELALHSEVSAQVDLSSVPIFAEALGCVRQGIIPGAAERNLEAFSEGVATTGDGDENLLYLLYDAQTSGGLLVSLPENRVEGYMEAMRARGHTATSRIGRIVAREGYFVQVALGEPSHLIGTYRLPEPATVSVEACCEHPPGDLACCAEFPAQPLPSDSAASAAEKAPPAGGMTADAFKSFMKAANAPGSIDARTKRLLNIALSVAQRCEPCIQIHIEHALSEGITRAEIDEAAWLAISLSGAPAKMLYDEFWRAVGGRQ